MSGYCNQCENLYESVLQIMLLKSSMFIQIPFFLCGCHARNLDYKHISESIVATRLNFGINISHPQKVAKLVKNKTCYFGKLYKKNTVKTKL